MSNDERSLAEINPETEDMMTAAVERGPLDVSEFLAGVRAVRRQAWVRPNLHLFADLERLVDEIEAADEATPECDALIDEYEALKVRFESRERWVVEQRSVERRRHVRREAAGVLGIELTPNGESVVDDDADGTKGGVLESHVIADHVVEPEGVTGAQIQALFDASPSEGTVLGSAIIRVNRVVDETVASEVLRDFSSRRSVKTKRSTKR